MMWMSLNIQLFWMSSTIHVASCQDEMDVSKCHSLAPPDFPMESEVVGRAEVEFEADGGVKLRGWLLVPPGEGHGPAIAMAPDH